MLVHNRVWMSLLSLMLVWIDLGTKAWFDTLVWNSGVSFGIGVPVWGLTLLYIGVTLWFGWMLFGKHTLSQWHLLGAAFLFGGALGNGYDRVMYSAVRDWIAVAPGLPVWNIADACLTIGACIYLFAETRTIKK